MQSYQHKCTGSHQNSVVKRAWARVVLGWVTSWEVLVLHPSFWVLRGTIPACHLSSQWLRPSPSAPGDRRSGHPITRYGPLKSRVWDFSLFSTAWKIPSFRDDRRKRQAFWTVEAKVMCGNAWWWGWVPKGIGEDMFHEAVGGPWCMEREIP